MPSYISTSNTPLAYLYIFWLCLEIILRNEECEVVASMVVDGEKQNCKQTAFMGEIVWGSRKHRGKDGRICAPLIPSKTWKALDFSDRVERSFGAGSFEFFKTMILESQWRWATSLCSKLCKLQSTLHREDSTLQSYLLLGVPPALLFPNYLYWNQSLGLS